MGYYIGSNRTSPIVNVWYNNTTAQTGFSSSGLTFLQTTFTPAYQNSKFLVTVTVNAVGQDDCAGNVQFLNGGSWVDNNNLRGAALGSNAFRGSFGDWSVARSGHGLEDKQTINYTAQFVHQPNVSGQIGYRVFIRGEGSSTSDYYINRPYGNDGGFNTNTGISTLTVMELAQ